MRVLILGAGGLIGRQLTRLILGEPGPVRSLILADRVPLVAPSGPALPVRSATGDITDGGFLGELLAQSDCVVHLAALLANEAEADLSRGMDVNVRALMTLLDACRTLIQAPMLVFTSSLAAFGGSLPEVVDDSVPRTPQTSYGAQKAIAELLIDDYSRRGIIDGRVLRLPIVLVRHGSPGGAVSDQVAALVREPLCGRDLVCGLAPGTRMPVASAARVAMALRHLMALPADGFGEQRAMNLPSLSVTAEDLVEAVRRSRVRPLGTVTFKSDAALQKIVEGWPRRFVSDRATRFGLEADASADEIVDRFIREAGLL